MSTLAYAALTSRREASVPGTGTGPQPDAQIQTYVDALAALVPAEVLAVHATIISFTTSKVGDTTSITAPGTLKGVFVALLILSTGLYVFGHSGHWDRWDFLRALIPPTAFVGWTMLQRTTAFDAVWPGLATAPRFAIALIGSIVLATVATALSYKANRKST